MSAPILPESAAPLGWGPSLRARVAVGIAFGVCLASPRSLQTLLTLLTKYSRPPSAREVLKWRNEVVGVSPRCAGEGCLQRSVAVMVLARLSGASPTWKTGIRSSPFVAHAWVEVDGLPVGEPEVVKAFRTTLEVVPDHQARCAATSSNSCSSELGRKS